MAETDQWADWLRVRRDGGSAPNRAAGLTQLGPIRDLVLDGAEPLAGATLLDVGCGDGLVGLAALDRVGAEGTVIFSDISAPLLEDAKVAVERREDLARARFLQAGVEDLASLSAGSVDVATSRSVLIYVHDKQRAFDELHRVLRPGGRLSIFEPINRHMFPEPADRFFGYSVAAVEELATKVKNTFKALEASAAKTMTDFDERDLFDFAVRTGFAPVRLQLVHELRPGSVIEASTVDGLLASSPNPLAPTISEAIEQALDPTERDQFVACLDAAIQRHETLTRWSAAFLVGEKAEVGDRQRYKADPERTPASR